MLKIYAVCASGIGTSLFARKLIEDSIRDLGYDLDHFRISCVGFQETTGLNADLFITGSTIAKNIVDQPGTEKVVVKNMINDKEGMKTALAPVLEKAKEAGKIKMKE